MKGYARKLITVITEAVLEEVLIKEIEKLGVHGYTITDARGKGSRGIRNAGWDASSNIRIEVLCDETVASAVVVHLRDNYYENFAMILFETDVSVLRPEKF